MVTTKEYKVMVCDTTNIADKHLLIDGISATTDIDSLYNAFERNTLIYISRNRNTVIIYNNTFTNNIGTFGGAISINSPVNNDPDSTTGNIIIDNNRFYNNSAYFSGNAIYIQLTRVATIGIEE
jgi:hypothetical protein